MNFTDGRSLRLFRGQALLDGKDSFELTQDREDNSALILDEGDDTLFNQTFDRSQIARPLPRFSHMDISWISYSAVEYVNTIKKKLSPDEVFNADDITLNPTQEIALFKQYLLASTTYSNEFLALQSMYKDAPDKLDEQITIWLKAALDVLELKENDDFEIQSGRLRKTERGEFLKASDALIVVNGRRDKDSRWGRWVHSCLEARLNIEREEKMSRGEYVPYDSL